MDSLTDGLSFKSCLIQEIMSVFWLHSFINLEAGTKGNSDQKIMKYHACIDLCKILLTYVYMKIDFLEYLCKVVLKTFCSLFSVRLLIVLTFWKINVWKRANTLNKNSHRDLKKSNGKKLFVLDCLPRSRAIVCQVQHCTVHIWYIVVYVHICAHSSI